MTRNRFAVVSAVLTACAVAASWGSAPEARGASSAVAAIQEAFVETAAKAKPAVVNISIVQNMQVRSPDFFFFEEPDEAPPREEEEGGGRSRTYRVPGTGSGFIIDPKGLVVTNDHVVGKAMEIRVTLSNTNAKDKTYPAKVVGRDPSLDLAVIQIEAPKGQVFPYLKFANREPRVGEWAMAIGSPFALEQTVTVGIISAQRQSMMIEGKRYATMIQTDAAINRGNSGGPLLDLDGNVIGVNTAIYSPSGASAGVGFAIPASEVKETLSYLVAGKRMPRGWLGIETAPVDEVIQRRFALPSADGALVNRVFPKSPADKAGIQRGDVIRTFNKKTIATPDDLISAASHLESGRTVDAIVYRKGAPVDLTITLGQRPEWADEPGSRQTEEEEGGEENGGGQAPQDESQQYTWEGVTFVQDEGAVTVADVGSDSALNGELAPDDVIKAVNESQIGDLDQLRAALKKAKLSDGVFFDILRDGRPMYLSVKP